MSVISLPRLSSIAAAIFLPATLLHAALPAEIAVDLRPLLNFFAGAPRSVVDGAQDRLLGLRGIRRIEEAIAARAKRAHNGLGLATSQHALHDQGIGDNEASELELPPKKIGVEN